ncbi:hypothetical protein ACRAWF_22570, partial [Streptomyces sp. L7]
MSGTWTRARARSTTCPSPARILPLRPSPCRSCRTWWTSTAPGPPRSATCPSRASPSPTPLWLAPSSAEGFIEGQAGFRMVGNDPTFDATRLKWQKTPGAVNVDHGHGIGFEDNTFTHLGAVGPNLNTGTQGTDITGNVFRQIAATGIQIGGVDVIDAHPDDPRDITKDTQVADNVVTKVADQYNGSIGILAGYTDHT